MCRCRGWRPGRADCAWFALAVAVFSIIIVRSGILEIEPALATFAAALIFAGLAILLAFGAFVVIWRQGLTGLGRAVSALLLGLLLLAYPGYLGYRASKLPQISDITTDPAIRRASACWRACARAAAAPIPARKPPRCNSAAYPDIDPVEYDAPSATAYGSRWPSSPSANGTSSTPCRRRRRRDGVIEAVARTLIMGFRDDVVMRVRADGGSARIDVRSASRYGLHDFGTNAKRVAPPCSATSTTP